MTQSKSVSKIEPFYDFEAQNGGTPSVSSPRKKSDRSKIAVTFWGKSWVDNLERYHDYERRMPLGKACLRSGGVVHLEITKGLIYSRVSDDQLHEVHIRIKTLEADLWQALLMKCSREKPSLLDLLGGRLPESILLALTDSTSGVFPMPTEIKMTCSCIDDATVCKHVAATLYAVGRRLDTEPQLFFILRSINQDELIAGASSELSSKLSMKNSGDPADSSELDAEALSKIFGVEIDLS